MFRQATLLEKDNRVVVVTGSRTVDGLGVWAGPLITTEGSIGDESILPAVLEALAASRDGLPQPDFTTARRPALFPDVVKALGGRSTKRAFEGVICVEVSCESDGYHALPTRNFGRSRFDHLPPAEVAADQADLCEALARARTRSSA